MQERVWMQAQAGIILSASISALMSARVHMMNISSLEGVHVGSVWTFAYLHLAAMP